MINRDIFLCFFLVLVLFPFSLIGKESQSSSVDLDLGSDESLIGIWVYAEKTPLLISSDSLGVVKVIGEGDSAWIDKNLAILSQDLILSIIPKEAGSNSWSLEKLFDDNYLGQTQQYPLIVKKSANTGALVTVLVILLFIVALIRVINNFSYSFFVQPFVALGKVSWLDQYSSGIFPVVLLSLLLVFSFLTGWTLDLCLSPESQLRFLGFGFLFSALPSSISLLLFTLTLIFFKFLAYNFLGYLSKDKEFSNSLFTTFLVLGNILLLLMNLLIVLAGFAHLLLDQPEIVPMIFFIFAAIFGIGMVFSHLNVGGNIPISMRFFGIVAMEILPTIFIVKILFKG